MLRIRLAVLTGLSLAAVAPSVAQAQVYITSITASFPDANGKVPAFNAVPGSAIATFSIGDAQGVLTHGQSYNYCVSIASGTAQGSGVVSFKITRGSTIIQSANIIQAKNYSIGPNGVWYYCSGYKQLPDSPGAATLTGTVVYTPKGTTTHKASSTRVAILLQ